ncbi:MAG: FctA domain-containing protein, partial [Acutalibacteraceae bacterium]|nr:FctA domain-containing protein [Acutalibacteraceae bacterium]
HNLDVFNPDFRIEPESIRLIKAKEYVQIQYLNGYNDATDSTKIDDRAPEGYEFAGTTTDSDTGGWQIKLNRAKPVQYFVRLVFEDTGKASELGKTGDLYVLVNVVHNQKVNGQNVVTYAYKKIDLATMGGKDGNGNYVIDVPFTPATWYNQDGSVAENEQYTGNELGTVFSLYGVPEGQTPSVSTGPNAQIEGANCALRIISNGSEVGIGDYINQYQVTGTEDTIRQTSADGTKTNIIDTVVLEKNDDTFGLYSLEKILSGGYNIVTLCKGPNESMPKTVMPDGSQVEVGQGDAYIGCHQMGSVLIRGDVTFAAKVTGLADSPNADNPSVIGGYMGATTGHQAFINNRTNNTDYVPFYLGSSNTVVGNLVNGANYYQAVGGKECGINYCGETIVNDDYVDWDLLQQNIRKASRNLAGASTSMESASNGSVINVDVGSNVTINCSAGDDITINLIVPGEAFETINGKQQIKPDLMGTVINFLNATGTMKAPRLRVNGQELTTVETGAGISIVYNYPNLTGTVEGPAESEFGHIVAPKALIKITTGNYSGTMVGNNAYIGEHAEGHLYPYIGGTLVGFYGNINAGKQTDDHDPTEKQKYTFNVEQLRGDVMGYVSKAEYDEIVDELGTSNNDKVFWERIQTANNEGADIAFTDISFYRSGKYYFRVTEDLSALKPNVIGDETQYLIECEVESIVSGEKNILRIKDGSIKIYKIKPNAELLTVENISNTQGEVLAKHPQINQNALEQPAQSLSWDSTDELIDSGVTFINETLDVDAMITFDGTKTFEGGDLSKHTFRFEVFEITRDENQQIIEEKKVSSGTSNSEGNIKFRVIGYKSEELGEETSRTYEYIIREVIPEGAEEIPPKNPGDPKTYKLDDIVYDGSERTVHVVVALNEETGELTATRVEEDPAITFANKWELTGTAEFSAKKTLDGKAKDGFTFILSDGTNEYTAVSGTDGRAVFDPITFIKNSTKDDTKKSPYTFTIREDVPAEAVNSSGVQYQNAENKEDYFKLNNISYDGHIHTVQVSVADTGTNKLEIRYDDDTNFETPVFANKALVSIPVKKEYSAPAAAGTEAVFTLLRYTKTMPTGTIVINHNVEGDLTELPDSVVYKANSKVIHSGATLNVGDYTITVLGVSVDGYTEETVISSADISITEGETTTVNITTTYTQQPGVLRIEHVLADGSDLDGLPAGFAATYTVTGGPGSTVIENPDIGSHPVKPGTYTVTETITNADTPDHFSTTEPTGTVRSIEVVVRSNETGTATFTSKYTRDKGTLNLTHNYTVPEGKQLSEGFSYILSNGKQVYLGDNTDIPTGSYTLTVSGGTVDGYNASTTYTPVPITVEKDEPAEVRVSTVYTPTVPAKIVATFVQNGQTLYNSENETEKFYPGDTIYVRFKRNKETEGYYEVNNDRHDLTTGGNASEWIDFSVVIPSDGIVNIKVSDGGWVVDDEGNFIVSGSPISGKYIHMSYLIASASGAPRRTMRYIASNGPIHGSKAAGDNNPQEGYDQDNSFAMSVTLTAPDDLEGIFENLELTDEDGNPYYYYLYESSGPSGYTASDPIMIKPDDLAAAASAGGQTNTQTITNTYKAEGSTQLEAKKAIEGAEWPSGKSVTFTLAGTGDAPMPAA